MADERCQETRVLFGVPNSHRDLLLLTPGYALLAGSMRPFGRTSAPAARPPTRSTTQSLLLGLGDWLSPNHLRNPHSRPVRYYALFKGWLLLSLPSGCFRMETPCVFALSQCLGALTQVSVVPVTAYQLTRYTRLPPSTRNVNSEFDKRVIPLGTIPPNQCSTLHSVSSEAILRDISEGTRYRQVR